MGGGEGRGGGVMGADGGVQCSGFTQGVWGGLGVGSELFDLGSSPAIYSMGGQGDCGG